MLSERLKALRSEKDISQRELANIMKLSPSTIAMYETNQRDPDTHTLQRLADFFDVSVDYLLGRTDYRSYEPETIAAHHDGDEWTEEELSDIEKFKEYVRMRRDQKGASKNE